MDNFMNGLRKINNYTLTENGAITYKSTLNALCDLFGQGASYRKRSDADCILLFKNAYEENPTYALKCLFYIHDIRQGQGERRFFRVVYRWLIDYDIEAARRNLQYIPEYSRWDNLIYICEDTPLWDDCIAIIKKQLAIDMDSMIHNNHEGISLLAKWLPSINTSSSHSRKLANQIRVSLNMTPKQYRQTLTVLRQRIHVLEQLMSANKWDEIEFDKIPSKAGFKYRNAFAKHDLERANSDKNIYTYEEFINDKQTTVNAKDLYPHEIVEQALDYIVQNYYSYYNKNKDDNALQRNVINKYWDNFLGNLNDFLQADFLAICDTSGSMHGTPMNVAIALSMCCAEKARGPFAHHYISFASRPQLIKIEGIDFVDKVERIYKTNLCDNTNIEATFDMLLKTAIKNNCKQEDLPRALIILTDMQFDTARGRYYSYSTNMDRKTLMENIEQKWTFNGYKMPSLYFWNLDARSNSNIPMELKDGITYISGFSPVLLKQIASGKSALDFIFDILNSERYAVIK